MTRATSTKLNDIVVGTNFWTWETNQNISTFGYFDNTEAGDNASATFKSMVITLSCTGGFTDINSIFGYGNGTAASPGWSLITHIYPLNAAGTARASGVTTGFAAAPPPSVPEPSTLLLLGLGLSGLAFIIAMLR